jgi:hypothetical protein
MRTKKNTITHKCQCALRKGFTANIDLGIIFSPTKKIVSKTTHNGYIQMCIRYDNKTMYLLGHQFIFFLKHNKEVTLIDHINGNKKDNSISNLREASKQLNALNTKKTNGVYLDKRTNRFESGIVINNKKIYLGKFDTYKDANLAYLRKKNELLTTLQNQ